MIQETWVRWKVEWRVRKKVDHKKMIDLQLGQAIYIPRNIKVKNVLFSSIKQYTEKAIPRIV